MLYRVIGNRAIFGRLSVIEENEKANCRREDDDVLASFFIV